jgi:chromate transporter
MKSETQTLPANKIPLLKLFLHFFKLGCTSFGGAAMVHNIRHIAVEKLGLLDGPAFEKGVAFCQIIPGATAMQTSAYCGLKARGQAGAAAAYLGFGLPAFIIISILSWVYGHIGIPLDVFDGVRIGVIAIIFHAAYSLGKSSVAKVEDALFIIIGLDLFLLKVHPLFAISIAAMCGFLFSYRTTESKPDRAFSDGLLNATSGENGAGFYQHDEGISVPWRSLVILSLIAVTGLLLLRFFKPEVFTLALAMVRVSLLSFGGGFTSVPLMYQEIVEHLNLMPSYDFTYGIALGQITPGPLTIFAAFVGYLTQGFLGGVSATIFVFLPSFLLVIGFAGTYDKISRNKKMTPILNAVYLSFVGLIAGSGVRLIILNPMDWKQALICLGIFGALYRKLPPFFAVLLGLGVWQLLMLFHST